ncbi:MAG: hypothetical protein MUO64_07565 [Anaerolineales bacterium]|nr:hypothetical protein [Anaerolineales bacterium]
MIGAGFPYLFSATYFFLVVDMPLDIAPIEGQIDDGTAMTFSALFPSLFTSRINPKTPKWVFVPLVLAAIYTSFGGVFPGPFDELVAQIISFSTFAKGASKQLPAKQAEAKYVRYLPLTR